MAIEIGDEDVISARDSPSSGLVFVRAKTLGSGPAINKTSAADLGSASCVGDFTSASVVISIVIHNPRTAPVSPINPGPVPSRARARCGPLFGIVGVFQQKANTPADH
ncbi:hypothetical protein J6590_015294 [Homalodisca vitripennis]|nr:hypothetical protein J6590_015294 [Homalodisca vitripennis]